MLEGVDGKIKYITPITISQGQSLTNSSQENLETTYSFFKIATISRHAASSLLRLLLLSQRSGEYCYQFSRGREAVCFRSTLALPSTLPLWFL